MSVMIITITSDKVEDENAILLKQLIEHLVEEQGMEADIEISLHPATSVTSF